MNPFIETLNQSGGQFLNFAWPMLWQSSLLIAFIFALDFLLARKIRASVRYALWLAVLVKLILPPTLASPTGATWWLFQDKTEIKIPAAKNYTVTYDNAMPPMDFAPQTIPLPAPLPPKLNFASWMLLAAVVVSAGLLIWLAIRWWQVARKVRSATTSEEFSNTLTEARLLAGLRSRAKLKLVEGRMSPAVCGLFRPVILLPRTLVEFFSAAQLRAVLLHEIFHLRRKDVWVNCAQALLQIFYWWHPLLWIANARIRRVREEAVDDAVMLALRDEAETYAPTLLEVAKLAFHRPLMSLGLVGIMESRSALRQRIERLVDFRAPKKAGLTFMSLCGIFVFSAVALPMGEAPAPADGQISPATASAPIVAAAPKIVMAEKTLTKTVLITSRFYWLDDVNLKKATSILDSDSSGNDFSRPEKINQVTDDLRRIGLSGFAAPRVVTVNHETATISVMKGTNGIALAFTPNITNDFVSLAIHGSVNEDSIHRQIDVNSTLRNHVGIIIFEKDTGVFAESNLLVLFGVQIDPTNFSRTISKGDDGQLVQDGKLLYEMGKLDEAETKLKAALALNPDNAAAQYYAILVGKAQQSRLQQTSPGRDLVRPVFVINSTNLLTRAFKVDPNAFLASLRKQDGSQTNDVSTMLISLSSKLGVDWESPAGKSVVFNDGSGLLFVRATESDSDTIENLIQSLNQAPPQIHITARFVEVPKDKGGSPGGLLGWTNPLAVFPGITASNRQGSQNSDPTNAPVTAVLTDTDSRIAFHYLELRPGFEELAEPEATTLSGRQMQMRATEIDAVVTNFVFQEISTNQDGQIMSNSVVPQIGQIETGPILDVVPYLLSDGYTINLALIPSLTEFLGYGQPPPNMVEQTNASGVRLPVVLPRFRVRQVVANVNLWDNQTVVLGGLPEIITAGDKDLIDKPKTSDKELLVFITATIVDPAGNRVHSDDDMPFAKNAIPQQPSQPR